MSRGVEAPHVLINVPSSYALNLSYPWEIETFFTILQKISAQDEA